MWVKRDYTNHKSNQNLRAKTISVAIAILSIWLIGSLQNVNAQNKSRTTTTKTNTQQIKAPKQPNTNSQMLSNTNKDCMMGRYFFEKNGGDTEIRRYDRDTGHFVSKAPTSPTPPPPGRYLFVILVRGIKACNVLTGVCYEAIKEGE